MANRRFNGRLNGINELAYMGVNPVSPTNFTVNDRTPTVNDWQNFTLGDEWLIDNSSIPENQNVYKLVSLENNQAIWVLLSSGSTGAVTELTGDIGGPVLPLAGNINVISNVAANNAGSTVLFSGLTPTLTLNVSDADLNTFIGAGAGNLTLTPTVAIQNTGIGQGVLASLTTGAFNTSIGQRSLDALTTGMQNTAVGLNSMGSLVSGDNNIAVGISAGNQWTTNESANIILGINTGVVGESNTTRIGGNVAGALQTRCFISGIQGVNVGSVAEVVSIIATGQLGSTVLTAGAGITITPGANTITISGTGADLLAYTNVNTTPYVVLTTDEFLGVDSSGGARQINLPNAPATGRVFVIKDRTGSANTNNITITTVGGAVNIDGATTYVMNTQYSSVSVIWDGATYQVW